MRNYRLAIHNPIRTIKSDGGYTSIFRRIGFIGDSLSSGEHESYSEEAGTGWWDYYEYSWGQYIGRMCGLEAINFSRGGLTAKEFFSFTVSGEANANNIFDKDKICPCYVIALGVNDVHHLERYSEGFGSMDDVDLSNEDNNRDSFVGWYVKIIQKLRKLEPKCRIFVMTVAKEKPESKEQSKMYKAIVKFLEKLPKYFEFLYVINLRKYAPIYNKKFNKKYWLAGHMSAAGYKFTADMVSSYMDYIIRHNPDDFKQVGFIGKQVHNTKFKW